MTNETLNNLFNDVVDTGRALPEQSHLIFITEIDSDGKPDAYGVYGDIYDAEAKDWFPVAEYTTSFDRAFDTLKHYVQSFGVTDVRFESRIEA